MAARGKRVEVAPRREGRKAWGATPLGWDWPEVNGQPYYCQRGLWPERCREGRNDGPVAPDGHPYRVACERQFLQLDCPYFTLESDEHMSYDPYVCINESGLVVEDLSPEACVNQNHPRNVEVCGQTKFGGDPSWVKEEHLGHLYVVAGEWSWATAHGNGKVCASAKDGVAKKCVKYTEP